MGSSSQHDPLHLQRPLREAGDGLHQTLHLEPQRASGACRPPTPARYRPHDAAASRPGRCLHLCRHALRLSGGRRLLLDRRRGEGVRQLALPCELARHRTEAPGLPRRALLRPSWTAPSAPRTTHQQPSCTLLPVLLGKKRLGCRNLTPTLGLRHAVRLQSPVPHSATA